MLAVLNIAFECLEKHFRIIGLARDIVIGEGLCTVILTGKLGIEDAALVHVIVECSRGTKQNLVQDLHAEILFGKIKRIGRNVAVLNPDGKLRARNLHVHLGMRLIDGFALLAVTADDLLRRRLGQHLVQNAHDAIRLHLAAYAEHHVAQIVEGIVAFIKQVGRDLGNRLDRSGDLGTHIVLLIHGAQCLIIQTCIRVVLVHADLLCDDALLFSDGLGREIRMRDKVEQNLKRRIEIVRRGKEVRRFVK